MHAWVFDLYQSFNIRHLILCIHNEDTLNICIKKFDAQKFIFYKIEAFGTKPCVLLFLNLSAQIVYARGMVYVD